MTTRSCSWCHTSNPADRTWCLVCGHAAHLPRSACDCQRCREDREDDLEREQLRREWVEACRAVERREWFDDDGGISP